MAIRASMQDIIVRTRELTGDPAGPNARFSDDVYQEVLDRDARTDYILGDYRALTGRYTLPGSPPSYAWTDYFDPSGWGDWETDATLYNGSMTLLTPLTSDYLVGHWTFANQPPPVYLMGKTYDVYGAARAIVLRWIGLEATSFDFSAMRGTSFTVSQKREGLQMLADQLATEMRVRTAKLVRRDVNGAFTY